VRWLLIKDLQLLRRSPLLVALLVAYPIVLALMIGSALSSPPGKPRVAFYDEVPPGHGTIAIGSQHLDVANYASELLRSIQPLRVHSAAQAIDAVRSGRALAAVIIPSDLPAQIQSLVTQGFGTPTVQIYVNTSNPLERQFVDGAIASRLAGVQQSVSRQILRVAVSDLQQVLGGGTVQILGQRVPLLGLRNARTIIQATLHEVPAGFPLRAALGQVVDFADLAIQGLGFASPVLGSIGSPLKVDETQLAGRTTPTDAYAASIAVVVSVMIVTMLLAAGMLALERSENVYGRLVSRLVSPAALLGEKVALSGAAGALVGLVMSALVSVFVALSWSRVELWILALLLGGWAFGALGVALGAVAREVSAASLLAFAVALPVAFVALVPGDAVSPPLGSILAAVAFVFPFRAMLQAVANAFTGAAPGLALPLIHLAVLALVFGGLAVAGMRRFAAR
jgi:hypothetical protein